MRGKIEIPTFEGFLDHALLWLLNFNESFFDKYSMREDHRVRLEKITGFTKLWWYGVEHDTKYHATANCHVGWDEI